MKKASSDQDHWNRIIQFFQDNFQIEDSIDVDTMLFLIGVQIVGKGQQKYRKDDKVNLIHVAVCHLLEPYGYYQYTGKDDDLWPQYELLEPLPNLQPNEQKLLMKKAIIHYFEEEELL